MVRLGRFGWRKREFGRVFREWRHERKMRGRRNNCIGTRSIGGGHVLHFGARQRMSFERGIQLGRLGHTAGGQVLAVPGGEEEAANASQSLH